MTLDNIGSVLARYSSSCKVKLTVQRAALLPTLVSLKKLIVTYFYHPHSISRLRRMSR